MLPKTGVASGTRNDRGCWERVANSLSPGLCSPLIAGRAVGGSADGWRGVRRAGACRSRLGCRAGRPITCWCCSRPARRSCGSLHIEGTWPGVTTQAVRCAIAQSKVTDIMACFGRHRPPSGGFGGYVRMERAPPHEAIEGQSELHSSRHFLLARSSNRHGCPFFMAVGPAHRSRSRLPAVSRPDGRPMSGSG